MVDLEELELASIGPGDELDGTKYLWKYLYNKQNLSCVWRMQALEASRPASKSSHHLWSLAGYKPLEASLPSSAEKDITSTTITLIGLL